MPKGEPGPVVFQSEVDLLRYLKSRLAEELQTGERFAPKQDGENHRIAIDGWVARQTLDVLEHYNALLTQRLSELIAPGFFHRSGLA